MCCYQWFVLLVLGFTGFTSNGFAFEASDPVVELSDSSFAFRRKLACEYVEYLQGQIDDLSEDQVKEMVQEFVPELESAIESADSRRTKKLLKKTLKDVRRLEKVSQRKDRLKRTLHFICESQKVVGGGAVRVAASVGSALSSLIFLPVRFTYSFGRGLFSGREPKKNMASVGKFLGRNAELLAIMPLKSAFTFTVMGHGNPLLIPFLMAPFIDQQSGEICNHPNHTNPRELKFCATYHSMKKGLSKAVRGSEWLGAQIHQFFEKPLCEMNSVKQVKLASDVLIANRESLMSGNEEIEAMDLLMPEESGCVQIRVVVKAGVESESIAEKVGPFIDGIPATYVEADKVVPTQTINPAESAESFCKSIEQERLNGASVPRYENPTAVFVQSLINPGRYGEPHLHEVTVPMSVREKRSSEAPIIGRNVVFYFSPTDEQRQLWKETRGQYYKDRQRLRHMKMRLKKIARDETYSSCVQGLKEKNFNFSEFLNLQAKTSIESAASVIHTHKEFKRQMKKAGLRFFFFNSLKLDWDIVEGTHFNELLAQIRDPHLQNIVILHSGDFEGKIADTLGNELPSNAFSWVGPQVQSISIYSPHSQRSLEDYRLVETLSTQKTVHAKRFAVATDGEKFKKEEDEAPAVSFGAFLEDLDRFLFRSSRGELLNEVVSSLKVRAPSEEAFCQFRLKGISAVNSDFSVELGNHLLGYLNDRAETQTFSAPCSWLSGDAFFNITLKNAKSKNGFLQLDRARIEVSGAETGIVYRTTRATKNIKGWVKALKVSR